MTTLSQTVIGRMATDILDEQPIVSFDDDTKPARWLKRNYALQRDQLLRLYPWNFAFTRTTLSALTDAPTFGWKRKFQLPTDYLGWLKVYIEGAYHESDEAPIEIEGRVIMTDLPAPLKVRYVQRVTDETLFDPLFAAALAARMAARMARPTTGVQTDVERYAAIEQAAYDDAARCDAMEQPASPVLREDWTGERFEA